MDNVTTSYIDVNPLHAAARQAATFGMAVFPIEAGTKDRPLVKEWPRAATTDPAQIDAWWTEYPNANIGWVPGRCAFVIVDLDCKPGKPNGRDALAAIEVEHELIPRTCTLITPSGGEHRIFNGALPSSAGRIAPGVDIRGGVWKDGEFVSAGYGLLPPSVVDGKPYVWTDRRPENHHTADVPAWLARMGRSSTTEARKAPEGVELDTELAIDTARAWLLQQPPATEGTASEQFYRYACRLKDWALSLEQTAELLAEFNPGYDPDDIAARVANAFRYGQNEIGSDPILTDEEVFGDPAEIIMWRDGNLVRLADYLEAHPREKAEAKLREATAELAEAAAANPNNTADPEQVRREDKAAAGEGRWPLTHIRDRATALARPKPVMLVEQIIPDRKLIMPWGDTGCGKTYWTAEVVTAVAMRRPAFGKYAIVKPGDTGIAVIFAGEDCDYLDQTRLTAIEQRFERSLQGLVYTVDTAIPINDPNLFNIYRDELRRLQDIAGKPIDIIANDTLKRSLGLLKQNDDDTGRRFTLAMEGLIDEFACPILCNAHQPKSGPDGAIAGSGDFTANAPVTPHLMSEKDSSGRLISVECRFEPKFRVGPAPMPFTARCEPVTLPAPIGGVVSDLVLVALTAAEQAGRITPAKARLLSEQEDRRTVERVLAEQGAHDLDSGLLGEVLSGYLAGGRLDGETENEHALRKRGWKTKLDNGARRPEGNPAFAGLFDMDARGDGTPRIPRPMRRWFLPVHATSTVPLW
jgi:hypothetical protein